MPSAFEIEELEKRYLDYYSFAFLEKILYYYNITIF